MGVTQPYVRSQPPCCHSCSWATDTALQVLEYVLVLKGMLSEFQARKKP